MCEEPLLQRADFSQNFISTTDASGFAIGGILSQGKIGKDKPIASRSLNGCERKYDTYEKEALAIIYCVTYFRPYLYRRKFTLVTDHKPLVWFQNSKDPCSRVTRWKLKLAEYDFDIAYKAGKTNVNADALSRNPIDLDDIENDDINNKNIIEISLIERRNAKSISDFKCKEKVPETNLTGYEKIDYEGNIEENNFKKSKQFINKKNISKNKNNRRNYDGLKYKAIEDEDTDYSYSRGNEDILINDGNLIKNMKNKEQNDDINNEDIEKQQIYENYEDINELHEGPLFENINKRYYDDFNEGKIDGKDTEEIKQLLKEEYLLKNDDDNDGKSCIELDFKNTEKEAIYKDNEQTTEKLDEEFNIMNKRLINVIMNKMKNKENGIAFCKSINEEIISET